MDKSCSKCGGSDHVPFKGGYCRSCQAVYRREHYQINKEKIRIQMKIHYLRNKDKIRNWKNLWARDYLKIRRQEWHRKVDLLKAGPCTDCGSKWPSIAMDFDHIRSNKSGNISTMIGQCLSWERIEAEIAKCELVCACCHRIRTTYRRLHRVA